MTQKNHSFLKGIDLIIFKFLYLCNLMVWTLDLWHFDCWISQDPYLEITKVYDITFIIERNLFSVQDFVDFLYFKLWVLLDKILIRSCWPHRVVKIEEYEIKSLNFFQLRIKNLNKKNDETSVFYITGPSK